MTILLSEYDRGVLKIMMDSVPWSGGEEGMSARLKLENELKISELSTKYPANYQLEKLPTKTSPYKLPQLQVELMVSILCGGGVGAPAPSIGRVAAELVARIRKQCPRMSLTNERHSRSEKTP